MADVDPAVARLAFKGGAMDMIDAWIASVDEKMKLGKTRAQAVAQTVHEEPGLHREFVQGVNAGR